MANAQLTQADIAIPLTQVLANTVAYDVPSLRARVQKLTQRDKLSKAKISTLLKMNKTLVDQVKRIKTTHQAMLTQMNLLPRGRCFLMRFT